MRVQNRRKCTSEQCSHLSLLLIGKFLEIYTVNKKFFDRLYVIGLLINETFMP